MNTCFHSEAEDHSRPLSALQSESCKRETAWPLFSWVCLLLKSYNPLPENVMISPRIVTPVLATSTVLHPLTMHINYLESSHDVAAIMSSDQICTVPIGQRYFDQSVTCTCFGTFRAFYVFLRYVQKTFPSRG